MAHDPIAWLISINRPRLERLVELEAAHGVAFGNFGSMAIEMHPMEFRHAAKQAHHINPGYRRVGLLVEDRCHQRAVGGVTAAAFQTCDENCKNAACAAPGKAAAHLPSIVLGIGLPSSHAARFATTSGPKFANTGSFTEPRCG